MMTDQCDRYFLVVPLYHIGICPTIPWGRAIPVLKFHFRTAAKVLQRGYQVLLVIGALGQVNWTPRTALSWPINQFLGYFAITLVVCYAWPGGSWLGNPHNCSGAAGKSEHQNQRSPEVSDRPRGFNSLPRS
jgi:hypothetical protein